MSSNAPTPNTNAAGAAASTGKELRTRTETHVWTGRSSQWVNIKIYLSCILIIPLLFAWWYYLKVRTRTFELTTQRLKTSVGVLNRHIDEMELYRVKDTTLVQDVYQRMVGLATLKLTTSDPTTPTLEINSIPRKDAHFVREQIRELTEELRDRKRVREID